MKNARQFFGDPWLWCLFVVAGILLLTNLGNGCLWQDEAETAVLGVNTLRFGFPRAFDGINYVNPVLPLEKGYAWTYHSWLPIYMAAASFFLFGKNTWAARLPFALLGIAAVWLTYLLAKRLTWDLRIARMATLMLVLSVPFLLHMRQCRYYAPAVFFTLWAVLAYWQFFCSRRWAAAELSAALIFLFHADHGVFCPVLLAFILHFLVHPATPEKRRHGFFVFILVLIFTVPWMVYLKVGQHHRELSFKEISHHFQFYFRQINQFLVPIVFWSLLLFLFRSRTQLIFGIKGSFVRWAWAFVGFLIAIGMTFLIFVPEQRHFRYLIFLVPFFFIVQAGLMVWLFSFRPRLALLVIPLLLLTSFFYSLKIRSLPLEFLGELTHRYRGPVDGIVEFLRTAAKPGQTAKIPYEEHALMFYTDLVVEPLVKTADFGRETFPDWIILRRDWLPDGFFQSSYYEKIRSQYQEIVLDAPDIPWQNRPDPGYHRFRTDQQTPRVVLFQRRA